VNAMAKREPIPCLIVDDEHHARAALQTALAEHPEVEVIGLCENGLQAVKAINEQRPQLLFLDVQMPKLDGFDVLELVQEQIPFVIFVTAYDQYAVQAFEANAVDYLLKPVDPLRLAKAVEKVVSRVGMEEPSRLQSLLADPVRERELLRRILVRDGSEVNVLAVDTVMYIAAADDYVAIHAADATHIKLDRLSRLQKKLDPRTFCRIHRSYLLNVNFLARIELESKDSRIAVLKNQRELPISRSGYGNLQKLL